jgi:hypothetical protein
MSAEELRLFVRDVLEKLDDDPRDAVIDSLVSHAARGRSGWKPAGPNRAVVDEVESFVRAARRIGYAEPDDVDGYLRQGTTALLAGDPVTMHSRAS